MDSRASRIGVALLLLTASCTATTPSDVETTVSAATTTSSPTTTSGPVDLSARPLIWFQPLPERADPSLPFADGSGDFYDLFPADSPWETAAGRTQVFGIYSTYVRHYARDDQLRVVIDGVKRRGMALAMEVGPLPGPTDGTCVGAESYGGPDELELVRRIKSLGGTVDVIALDEPYAFGHKANGPTDCQRPVDQVAKEVFDFVTMVRREMPNVIVGDIEPMWAQPAIGVDDMSSWFDAYRTASGEDFAFIHMDAEWARPDWPEVFLAVEQAARERGIAVGVIYNGGEADSDEAWTTLAAERMFTYEQQWGGRPDQVVIQSWNDHPHRVLPDDDPSTLTGLVNRYLGAHTSITLSSATSPLPGKISVDAAVQDDVGSPVVSLPLSIRATPIEGQPTEVSISGEVPENASQAVVIFRVNTEGAGPGSADIRVYDVTYREEGSEENRVADPRFDLGMDAWAPYGDGSGTFQPSDRGSGTMLRLTASEDQGLYVDSTSTISVTPGTAFVLSSTAAIPKEFFGSAYVAMAFLDGDELSRVILKLTPQPIALGDGLTDGTGHLVVDSGDLEPGTYELRISYPGDLDHWPSYLVTEVEAG